MAQQTLSPTQLADRMLHRRAVEAVVWGMPVVNFDLMFQAFAKLGGDWNRIVWWPGLLDWKNQTLTPNPDVIYLMPFFNTEAGPVVFEVPPADDGVFNGSVMDRWQAAVEDIGPGGVDKGKGGKYLILPPGYEGEVPDGYIPMRPYTYRGYALVRSVLDSGSDEDVAKAVAYSRRLKVYPLSAAANPPETTYVDASGGVFDSTIPYDLRFFESLDRMVRAEPWLERDRAMIDPLKALGIARGGEPFAPDARTKAILDDAALEARAWIDTLYGSTPPFYEGRRWFFPVTEDFTKSVMGDFKVADSYPTDMRANAYSLAFFSAKHIGESQYYLMLGEDREGAPFDGSATYRLNVPARAPVRQYWSVTVYDRQTHAFIRELPRQGRSSQSPGLEVNADGSVDLYFGPAAPAGKDANWVPTQPGREFELLARFYGPTPELFQKTWRLNDVEKLA